MVFSSFVKVNEHTEIDFSSILKMLHMKFKRNRGPGNDIVPVDAIKLKHGIFKMCHRKSLSLMHLVEDYYPGYTKNSKKKKATRKQATQLINGIVTLTYSS